MKLNLVDCYTTYACVAVHNTGLRPKNTMLRHFTKDKKHLKIYKSDFFLHSVLEDMLMHQFMQN